MKLYDDFITTLDMFRFTSIHIIYLRFFMYFDHGFPEATDLTKVLHKPIQNLEVILAEHNIDVNNHHAYTLLGRLAKGPQQSNRGRIEITYTFWTSQATFTLVATVTVLFS